MNLNLQNGLNLWILQRISALFLSLYVICVLGFWLSLRQADDLVLWHGFIFSLEMKVLGFFSGVSLVAHACIGLWVVATDYIHIEIYRKIALWFMGLIVVISSILMLIIVCMY